MFRGPGLYAIYYTGNFPLYQPLAELACRGAKTSTELGPSAVPIYVGRASASASRRGSQQDREMPLRSRLVEHTSSITKARNLDIDHFLVRYLRVKDIWIPLGEFALLRRYTPIWNRVLDGFGNHDAGSGRYNQAPSPWDVLHPGRPWVSRLTGEHEPLPSIEARVSEAVDAIANDRQIPEQLLIADAETASLEGLGFEV
jgi:Eco29kI restriction endonuclease